LSRPTSLCRAPERRARTRTAPATCHPDGRFGTSAVDRLRCGPSASSFPLCAAPTQAERVEPATRRTPCVVPPRCRPSAAIISSSSSTRLLLLKTRAAASIYLFLADGRHSRRPRPRAEESRPDGPSSRTQGRLACTEISLPSLRAAGSGAAAGVPPLRRRWSSPGASPAKLPPRTGLGLSQYQP
jgi:hypothetical protein